MPAHDPPRQPDSASALSHVDEAGRARMVDVGAKPRTDRRARARTVIRMSPAAAAAVERGDAPKGDVFATARLAGIQAAKRAGELVPLAHTLALTFVDLDARVDAPAGTVTIESEVRAVAETGVEIEAILACAVAGVTVYDMVKGLEHGVTIEEVALLEKRGGKEDWRRP